MTQNEQASYQDEVWKDVIGYESVYQVSNKGRAKSFHRGRELILKPTGTDYAIIVLCKNGIERPRSLHTVIAETFYGSAPEGMVVNHIDGNKRNNELSNLEYCSRSQNTIHAIQGGFKKVNKGSDVVTSKLADDDVRQIRRLLTNGQSQISIAELFNVHQSTISNIYNNKIWRHIT